jgi:hypothetical protein
MDPHQPPPANPPRRWAWLTRPHKPDPLLWFVVSGCMFLTVAGVWVVTEGVRGALQRVEHAGLPLAVGCAMAGWLVHAVLVMAGVRLSGRPAPAEAVDYDDGR